MVKADIKHNYYADLDLPTSATIDEVKKQYRKLALQYHPDRNAGKEEEFVPKFQAIQTANEILGDPTSKGKYDTDRRKAGLYHPTAGFRTSSGPTGNPYQATSAYPPPPRRTQPGTWQRPTPSPAGTAPSGADRFSHFPRGAPTARKDPAQDRTNMFRAWQNMNNPQDRQKRNTTPNRPKPPPPPPREVPRMPTEEEIRAGMHHRKAPPPRFDGDRADQRQSAWAAFSQANSPKPGVSRSNTHRTPKKAGFDPSVLGSDERPSEATGYVHRNKSADFTYATDNDNTSYPPPPPRPRPTPSPISATTPSREVSWNDPLKSSKNRDTDDYVPLSAENPLRSPYGGLGGEKTVFSSEGLRRSASSRDTTKFSQHTGKDARASRSTSPPQQKGNTPKPPVDYSTSDSSDDTPESTQANQTNQRPVDARPKKMPTSRRTNQSYAEEASNEAREKDQQANGNMYANPRPVRNVSYPRYFDAKRWYSQMFGTTSTGHTTQQTPRVPYWAVPSTTEPFPNRKRKSCQMGDGCKDSQEQQSYEYFCKELVKSRGGIPQDLDLQTFLKLSSIMRRNSTTGHTLLDAIFRRLFCTYPLLALLPRPTHANVQSSSFNFPIHYDTFNSPTAKSRSEENINTSFTSGGWKGTFSGTPGYFAATQGTKRRDSPSLRSRQASGTTSESASGPSAAVPGPNSGQSSVPPSATSEVKFSKEQWENTFKDSSWSWPQPPPSGKTSPKKSIAKPKAPEMSYAEPATDSRPFVANENADLGAQDDGDAMDIDPPMSSVEEEKKPRLYSVPPSPWRQSQANKPPPASTPGVEDFATNLDDLVHVEPIARNTAGLGNLGDVSAALPFPSKAAQTLPFQPLNPQKLQLPPLPKAPDAPPKLTVQSWGLYVRQFEQYVRAYHEFNKRMLHHFTAREAKAQARNSSGTKWLEEVGDTANGFGGYLQGVREDVPVREAWSLGCEKHASAVEAFELMRARVKALVAGGGLPAQ